MIFFKNLVRSSRPLVSNFANPTSWLFDILQASSIGRILRIPQMGISHGRPPAFSPRVLALQHLAPIPYRVAQAYRSD
jgi:hypothetical protein